MRRGFTLIELLAVIVILAIIALIATPIILGIINDAKEDSEKRSVENYAHAVELAVARVATKQGGVIEEGTYTISNDGKIITSPSGKEITVDYKGEAVTEGTIEVEAKGKIKLSSVSFGGKTKYNYSENAGVEEANNTVFEGKIIFTPSGEEGAYLLDVCLNPNMFKDKSTYKVTITDSKGNENIYETISFLGEMDGEKQLHLIDGYNFRYIHFNDNCMTGSLDDNLKLDGEQNIKIEYLNSDNFPHNLRILADGAVGIISAELEEGAVTVEIKDNHGNIVVINDTVYMEVGNGVIYIDRYNNQNQYYNLLKQGETVTVTVTQNGKSYVLGGSSFTYEDDYMCAGELYYWGNNKLGYLAGC